MFNRSLLKVLDYRPWRWTTEPVYGNGPMNPPTVAGVKQELQGVFIMLSDELVQILKDGLTATQKDELDGWVNRYTAAQCAEWHVPVWAGQNSAVYFRVPATVWNDPTTRPPLKVRNYFRNLYREATT